MKEKTRQRHDVRQNQILQAVSRLITTKGMDSVTIKDIAEEVGVSEGALYRHFVSKRQMLSYLVQQVEAFLLQTVNDGQSKEASALETLEHILRAQISDVDGHPALSFIVIADAITFEGAGLGPQITSMLTDYQEGIQQVLTQGIREGSIRPNLHVHAAATTFLGIVQGTATMWALNTYTMPLAEHASQMWDIYRRAIAFTD